MRVLVCGGRDFNDGTAVMDFLSHFDRKHRITCIIHGAARGADSLGAAAAEKLRIPVYAFPADWERHGRAAGPIRNQKMLDEGRPDVVIAFPGGNGTADMIGRARRKGIDVIEVR